MIVIKNDLNNVSGGRISLRSPFIFKGIEKEEDMIGDLFLRIESTNDDSIVFYYDDQNRGFDSDDDVYMSEWRYDIDNNSISCVDSGSYMGYKRLNEVFVPINIKRLKGESDSEYVIRVAKKLLKESEAVKRLGKLEKVMDKKAKFPQF
ncbi:MAG: hypothetical protein L0I92_08110 [Staphylococcus equorum]|nr:hypothetical protein [Staphylococcus equorum]